MNSNPLISFVLPAYKAKYFKEAVDSILSQTYTNFELIIVNDSSPENLDAIVAQYNNKRIRYYKNEKNIGGTDLVAQWNHCITFAKGEYLVLASDDDMYYPNYLEEMLKLITKYPEVNLFHCRIIEIDKNNNINYIRNSIPIFESQLDFIYQVELSHRSTYAPEFIFKTQTLINKGGFINFPLAWHSDHATWYELAEKGVAGSNLCLFKWRRSGDNITSKRDNIKNKIQASNIFKTWLLQYLPDLKTTNDIDIVFKKQLINKSSFNIDNQIIHLISNLKWINISYYFFCKKITLKNKIKIVLMKLRNLFFL